VARAKVRLISRGMKSLLRDPGVARDLERRAERVAAAARASAPVDTGEYRDSITVTSETTDRAVARVVARDRKGHVIESRTGNLARALDSAGGA
jgi:hypothetical protein